MVRGKRDRGRDPEAALQRAAEAWCEVGDGAQPNDAVLLAGGRHATTVQLRTGDRARPSVVAKMRPRGGLDQERLIHETILPALGVETPEFLGFASGSDGASDVLFLEYVGSDEFQSTDRAHQDAAGRWLGTCHGRSAHASIPALLPRRDPGEERTGFASIRSRLAATLDNSSLDAEGRALVSCVLELLDEAMRLWPVWLERTTSVPMVLTHGAFVTRNIRVRGAGSSLTTLPFDWDHAAVRSPAVDLARTSYRPHGFCANASLGPYRDSLAASGLPLDGDVVDALATLGTVIRAGDCVGWLIGRLATEHVRQPLAEIAIYRRVLEGALSG